MPVLKHVAIWHDAGVLTIIRDVTKIVTFEDNSVYIRRPEHGSEFYGNVTQLTVFYTKQEQSNEIRD